MTKTKLNPEQFLKILKNKKKVYFIFDYDGTLVDTRNNFNEALLSDQQVDAINNLSQIPDTRIAIVTGRSMANLKMVLQGKLHPAIELYGSHGGEKNQESTNDEYKIHLQEIKQALINEANIGFEEKPLSITVHHPNHPDPKSLIQKLDGIAYQHQELFRVQVGHNVYEYLPKHINKGLAIQDIHENNPDFFLIFLGDDLTDNYGFKVINKIQGLAIQVQNRIKDSDAGYLIDRVDDTYKLIQAYLNDPNDHY